MKQASHQKIKAAISKDENNRLLSLLEAHGQEFLSSFDLPPALQERTSSSSHDQGDVHPRADRPSQSEEECNGFSEASNHDEEPSSGEEDEAFEADDGFTASSCVVDVIVPSYPTQRPVEGGMSSKALRKSFMVANITRPITHPASTNVTSEDTEDARTNARNDALLYRLLHTKLLSGSLNPELELSHAQREKALSGRIMELSGNAKLGKGESAVRQGEHNKASKHVREGILRKKQERVQRRLDEAKKVGNYHPVLKRLYASSSSSKRKRERGLGMGIGRFKGGILQLSQEEINSMSGQNGKQHRNGKGRHRG